MPAASRDSHRFRARSAAVRAIAGIARDMMSGPLVCAAAARND